MCVRWSWSENNGGFFGINFRPRLSSQCALPPVASSCASTAACASAPVVPARDWILVSQLTERFLSHLRIKCSAQKLFFRWRQKCK